LNRRMRRARDERCGQDYREDYALQRFDIHFGSFVAGIADSNGQRR
jgi:hypothetical protein